MLERRMLILVAALVVFLASAALWNAFVRPPARASAGATPSTAAAESVARTSSSAITPQPAPAPAPAPVPAPPPPPTGVAPVGAGGPSYLVLLPRSGVLRPFRAS